MWDCIANIHIRTLLNVTNVTNNSNNNNNNLTTNKAKWSSTRPQPWYNCSTDLFLALSCIASPLEIQRSANFLLWVWRATYVFHNSLFFSHKVVEMYKISVWQRSNKSLQSRVVAKECITDWHGKYLWNELVKIHMWIDILCFWFKIKDSDSPFYSVYR